MFLRDNRVYRAEDLARFGVSYKAGVIRAGQGLNPRSPASRGRRKSLQEKTLHNALYDTSSRAVGAASPWWLLESAAALPTADAQPFQVAGFGSASMSMGTS